MIERFIIGYAVALVAGSALLFGLSLYYGEWMSAVSMAATVGTGLLAFAIARMRQSRR